MRFPRESSNRRRSLATWEARSTGTLVNSDITSNETRVSSGDRVWDVMNSAKSLEFRILESVWPTNGERIVTRCLERW